MRVADTAFSFDSAGQTTGGKSLGHVTMYEGANGLRVIRQSR